LRPAYWKAPVRPQPRNPHLEREKRSGDLVVIAQAGDIWVDRRSGIPDLVIAPLSEDPHVRSRQRERIDWQRARHRHHRRQHTMAAKNGEARANELALAELKAKGERQLEGALDLVQRAGSR
jgi:hypothetical protein